MDKITHRVRMSNWQNYNGLINYKKRCRNSGFGHLDMRIALCYNSLRIDLSRRLNVLKRTS